MLSLLILLLFWDKCYNNIIVIICYNLISTRDFEFARQHWGPTTRTGVSRIKRESWNIWSRWLVSKNELLIRMWLPNPPSDAPKNNERPQKNCLNPVDTGRKLNVHKTFNLRPVSMGKAAHLLLWTGLFELPLGSGNLLSS